MSNLTGNKVREFFQLCWRKGEDGEEVPLWIMCSALLSSEFACGLNMFRRCKFFLWWWIKYHVFVMEGMVKQKEEGKVKKKWTNRREEESDPWGCVGATICSRMGFVPDTQNASFCKKRWLMLRCRRNNGEKRYQSSLPPPWRICGCDNSLRSCRMLDESPGRKGEGECKSS